MQKFSLQTLLVFSFGLIFGLFMKFSFVVLLALLVALIAVFIYTMRDAAGLKRGQCSQFIIVSATLYLVALLLSSYSIVVLVLFVGYEVFNKRELKTINYRMLPFFLITFLLSLKKMF
ncbi:MAG: hypothetical protein LE180_00965 [Endomicrobium sp.]|uniref:hypothetical protein n=1 Tax=Candidatus Endomicrobiellum pyrsonymphae TaxID=1408203 RepID=UPI00357302AD|nr:hypothetical protein [Endomicrobium sp.]